MVELVDLQTILVLSASACALGVKINLLWARVPLRPGPPNTWPDASLCAVPSKLEKTFILTASSPVDISIREPASPGVALTIIS